MIDNTILDEANALIEYLDKQHDEIHAEHEKFQIALAGILRLADTDSPIMKNLHGNPDNLKGYLIQLDHNRMDKISASFDHVRKSIDSICKLVLSSDRKS
ncbi:MAG: hypothetical protein JW779_09660 [Candidatus Thorarchaeota archaeon]|nr:hypothetical protein [Candidatus Thorarchaeota archaeon]